MSGLRTILAELTGLFVDDAGLAVAVVAWLCLVRLLLAYLPSAGFWVAIVLVAGLLAILIGSAARGSLRAARSRDPRL